MTSVADRSVGIGRGTAPIIVSLIAGAAVFMPRNTPTWLTSTTRRNCSGVVSWIEAMCTIPALFASASSLPNSPTA